MSYSLFSTDLHTLCVTSGKQKVQSAACCNRYVTEQWFGFWFFVCNTGVQASKGSIQSSVLAVGALPLFPVLHYFSGTALCL